MAMNNKPYDFGGWATKANLLCSDGRMIMRDAFKHNNGKTVPVVWNHDHNTPDNVLGHAVLENREDGVYAYCVFNDTERGEIAKKLVLHGDISTLSIFANKLKQHGSCVTHGDIIEVSLVLGGANPGALIDSIMAHGDGSDDAAIIYTGEPLELYHSEESHSEEAPKPATAEQSELKHSDKPNNKKEDKEMADNTSKTNNDKTVADVIDSMNEEQKTVMYGIIGEILNESNNDDEEEDKTVKHNLFDNDTDTGNCLSHADEVNIINLAKTSSVGTLKQALNIYAENNGNDALKHGFEDVETLFPDYKDLRPGAPAFINTDQGWVTHVMSKCEKSPFSRIRTKQADIRGDDLRGRGYVKGKKKGDVGDIKFIKRTTDPQTIYVKDKLDRDDVLDIEDFEAVNYLRSVMNGKLKEEVAVAMMIGDGREDGDEQKISEDHVRSIWHDKDIFTIHKDVDIEAAKAKLQGTNTSASFGDNYIYAEAVLEASLYAREDYKGSGALDLYCEPHLLNVMLLARDLNGRRIYDSKSDLAAALNVDNIFTVEQFSGKVRKTEDGKTKKLLGLFVNMRDYCAGCSKGGEITSFDDFDLDFNQYKYLTETRMSGALTRVYSAIALEEPVSED